MHWVSFFSYLLNLWGFACTFCIIFSVSSANSLEFVTLYFLKIFLFFVLSFPLSEPIPVSAELFSPIAYLSVHSYCLKVIIASIFACFARLIHCFLIIVAAAYIKLFLCVLFD